MARSLWLHKPGARFGPTWLTAGRCRNSHTRAIR